MNKEIVTRIRLIATAGCTLTNGENFGKVVFLGENDTADNWYEITDEDAEALQEQNGDEYGG